MLESTEFSVSDHCIALLCERLQALQNSLVIIVCLLFSSSSLMYLQLQNLIIELILKLKHINI